MAEEILELVARLRPEGAKETEDALQGAREEFEETADTVEASADDLEGFAQKFEGALGVAVAGLAVATGGLLSTVPVISEAFAGLGAILAAIGFQLDQFLRDIGAGGVTQFFFDLANSIFELDGVAGDIAGVLGGLAVALTAGATAAGLFAIKSAGVAASLKFAAGIVGSAIAAILGLPAAVLIAIAAIAALATAYIFNIGGFRDFTNQAFEDIKIAIAQKLANALIFIDEFTSDAKTVLGALPDVAVSIFGSLFALAISEIEFGKNVIISLIKGLANGIIGGFEGAINAAGSAVEDGLNNIISSIQSGVNEAITALNRLPEVNLQQVGLGRVDIGEVSAGRLQRQSIGSLTRQQRERRQAAGGDINDALLSVLERLANERAKTPTIELNGREVATGTARFINEATNSRGRFS